MTILDRVTNMTYFKKFGQVPYTFGDMTTPVTFTNLSIYADVIDQFKDDATVYETYTIREGERPDVTSYHLYGTTEYYWTFYIMNDDLRVSGWPLSSGDMIDHVKRECPGQVLVCSGSMSGADTDYTQPIMTDKFPIGTNVYGTASGALGTVYDRNLSMGQIFVTSDNGMAFGAETITDVIAGAPSHQLNLDSASETYLAIHHIEDADGNYVDGDPISGISASEDTLVTYLEFFESRNEELSNIRVLRKNVVSRFAKLFRDSIKS